MSDATNELKSALTSLCSIIECSIPDIEAGSISPELFRLAKQDDPNATKSFIFLILKIIKKSRGQKSTLTSNPKSKSNQNAEIELRNQLNLLSISPPKSYTRNFVCFVYLFLL